MRLVLASASPRRRDLLRLLVRDFDVLEPHVDEDAVKGSAEERVRRLAERKALAGLGDLSATGVEPATHDAVVVLGADTLIALGAAGRDERVLGKPEDRDAARRMLRGLSGRTHRVFTGVALARADRPGRPEVVSFVEATEVVFRELNADEIERHLDTGDAEGKAGAYGIQSEGRRLISGFRGCYYNVVGLPLARLAASLPAGIELSPGAGTEGSFACDCASHPLQQGARGCGRSFG